MNIKQAKQFKIEVQETVGKLNELMKDGSEAGMTVALDTLPIASMGGPQRQMLVAKVYCDLESIDDQES